MHGRKTAPLFLAAVLSALHAGAQESPAAARDTYTRALEARRRGDEPAALRLLWDAAGRAPKDADIQNGLGEALERVGALDAAIEGYRRALLARPTFAKASNNLILALVKAGRSREAVGQARTSAAAAPDDPDRLFALGLAQSEHDFEEAIHTFRRVLERAPRHTLARYNLALVLKRADRLREAVEELRRVNDMEPRPEAYYTLGVIHWHQGDADRAIAALGAAISLQPRHADAHYALGAVLYARREWVRAAAALRRAVALQPDLTGAHYTLGRVLESSGDDAAGRRHLDEAERLRKLTQAEQEARVWTAVGAEKLDAGNSIDALDCFRRAVAAYERYAPAHYQMGRALTRLGEHDAARAAFGRAQQLNPNLVPPSDGRL